MDPTDLDISVGLDIGSHYSVIVISFVWLLLLKLVRVLAEIIQIRVRASRRCYRLDAG